MNARIIVKKVLPVMLACAGQALAASSQSNEASFATGVFGSETNYSLLVSATNTTVYKLSGGTQTSYIRERKVVADYPIVSQAIEVSSIDLQQIVALLGRRSTYRFRPRLGVGFPRWKLMLTFKGPEGQLDILIWPEVGMVTAITKGRVLGAGVVLKEHKKALEAIERRLGSALRNQESGR